MIYAILTLLINSLLLQNNEIRVNSPTRELSLLYIKERPTEVSALTAENPVSIEISGPAWLKVDTRIPWHGSTELEQRYSIIVQEDSIRETMLRKRTFISGSIFGENDERYGESRYSLINVPHGIHTYTFFLWNADVDTVFLSFSFSEQHFWEEIKPIHYSFSLLLTGKEEEQTFYMLSNESPIQLKVSSPITLKVLTRLNYDKMTQEETEYTIVVKEEGKVIKSVSFEAEPSTVYEYESKTDLHPSKEDKFFLLFPRGDHTLSFHLQNAHSAALSFLKEVEGD